MPTARHGIEAAMWNGSAYITDGGLKQGGGAPTDVQEVLTVSPNYRPDTQIRLSTETSFTGNNIYNTTGSGQTKNTTSTPGSNDPSSSGSKTTAPSRTASGSVDAQPPQASPSDTSSARPAPQTSPPRSSREPTPSTDWPQAALAPSTGNNSRDLNTARLNPSLPHHYDINLSIRGGRGPCQRHRLLSPASGSRFTTTDGGRGSSDRTTTPRHRCRKLAVAWNRECDGPSRRHTPAFKALPHA